MNHRFTQHIPLLVAERNRNNNMDSTQSKVITPLQFWGVMMLNKNTSRSHLHIDNLPSAETSSVTQQCTRWILFIMLESEGLVFRLLSYHDVLCIAFVLHIQTENTATARTKILLFCCPHTQNTNICEIIWCSLFNHNKLLITEIVDISLSQAMSSTVMIIFSLSTSPEFYPIFHWLRAISFSDPSSLRARRAVLHIGRLDIIWE